MDEVLPRSSALPSGGTSGEVTPCGTEKTMTMIAPEPCRITHGPWDCYFENIVGKSVASIRRSLATVFSIPCDAQAFVGGSVVGGEYRLRAGESVVFLGRGWGRKGALEPEELALIEKEGLTMTEAAALLPGRKPGKRLYVNTVWRWCMKGLRNGARLRSALIGGQRLTTRRWLQEFIQAMSESREAGDASPPPVIRTPRQRQSASERAAEELKAAWKQRRRPSGQGDAPPPS
jgi:hypothetical protein